VIAVGDCVRLIAVAKAADSNGPPVGSIGVVTRIHGFDDNGAPVTVLVRFHNFNERIADDVEPGVWLVGVDEIDPTRPN